VHFCTFTRATNEIPVFVLLTVRIIDVRIIDFLLYSVFGATNFQQTFSKNQVHFCFTVSITLRCSSLGVKVFCFVFLFLFLRVYFFSLVNILFFICFLLLFLFLTHHFLLFLSHLRYFIPF